MSDQQLVRPGPVSGFPEWLPEVRHLELQWRDRIRQPSNAIRVFDDAALAADSVEALLRRVFSDKLPSGVTVSLAIWQVSGLVTGLYRWQRGRLKRVDDAPERSAVRLPRLARPPRDASAPP